MAGGAITTERLTLRPLRPADAPAVAEGIGRWEVIRWLTAPPWPYAPADAEEFIAGPASEGAMGIVPAGQGRVRGVVQLSPAGELGYWLHPEDHGRGLMAEAAGALLAAHFVGSEAAVWSGFMPENAASARVLASLGFRAAELLSRPHRALGREVEIRRVTLDAAGWRARCA